MYEQIDGFSTCRDLRRARPGGFWHPWVFQHGVQNRYMCLYLALRTSTWALGISIWANLGQLGPAYGQLRAILGPPEAKSDREIPICAKAVREISAGA